MAPQRIINFTAAKVQFGLNFRTHVKNVFFGRHKFVTIQQQVSNLVRILHRE